MADRQTIAFYDRDAESYAQSAIDHGERASLAAFEAALPRGADVLDLGCGGGHESAWLIARGHRVVSQDASAGLAAEAYRRFGLSIVVAEFVQLENDCTFDGVWSAAALHHARVEDLPDIVARVARALRPGGLLSATMKCGEDRRDSLGRFYCAMSAGAARALFAGPAWRDVEIRESVGAGHDGVETPWLIISARKA
jgi:SAM-dependent methyltransferase